MSATPRHMMILASAGSGKTFALTNRFVELLAGGARPERIVALTFTRKAAGEFFDEILRKLAGAARSPEAAEKLARDIGHPRLGCAEFLGMLRQVVEAMPRLRLGTLDGFFARIVRIFPFELGLAGEFELLQPHAAQLERQRVLRRIFVGLRGEGGQAQADFIEEFKRATFGTEEKRLGPRLDRFLDEHLEIFLSAPAADLWGQAERIWPRGNPWLLPPAAADECVRRLREGLQAMAPAPKQAGRWEAFIAALAVWAPGATLPKELAYVLEKALAAWDDLPSGRAVLHFDRHPQSLSAPAGAALAELVRRVFGGELQRRLEATRGIHAMLRAYEDRYHETVRRAGKLTFADVQRLLQPRALSGRPAAAAADDRLYLDFRLDAEIDHWLLDEFQDTSFAQWGILRNLIDEAVQDAEGRRSFFCVGDVKQAIFRWRGGDPRLFREIYQHYNTVPGTIAEKLLVDSWRSGPPLIAMVNTVFGGRAELAELFPEAGPAWSAEWKDHISAKPEHGGQAALLHGDDEAAREAIVLQLLAEIQPLERGLSCAVLVQTNAAAAALADFLRRVGGWPAMAESDLQVCVDNPLGAALLALFQAASHPGDRLAWGHLRLTPLGGLLAADGLDDPAELSRRLLGQIHAAGFERTAEAWLRRLEPRLAAADRFSRERGRQFSSAAAQFDQTGSRDVTEFIEFMGRHTVRDLESPAVIRVMTIHKSKGLGFDLVLLPDLEGQSLGRRRDGLGVERTTDREVDWILDLPPDPFWENDPVLAAHVHAAKAEACHEKLSLLYVAMTRAKRAMYAITKPVGTSASANFPKLLANTLGRDSGPIQVGDLKLAGAWSAGAADWHRARPKPAPRPPEAAGPGILDSAVRVVRRVSRRPSAEKSGAVAVAALFAPPAAADFGTAVHAVLSRISWTGDLAAALADLSGPVADEVRACLEAAELAAVWARPEGAAAELWLERSFEVVIGETWLSGKFDRVVIAREAAGRAVRATVFDFKTDRFLPGADLAAEGGRHAGQLQLYQRAVAVLAGLPAEAVEAQVVFTHPRRRVVLPPLTA
jgi:ATP-dependent helicase/nuclease subunit A